jgi:hypothetical protein
MSHVLYKGTDYHCEIQITDEAGTAISLTGKTLSLVVKRTAGGSDLITLTSGSGITHRTQTGDDIGWADAVITAVQSADLDAPSLHVVHVKLDGQVVVRPRHLEVVLV